MTHTDREADVQEINRLAGQEQAAGLDAITLFCRRMARYFTLMPPLENPFMLSPATPDSINADMAGKYFRNLLKINNLD